MSRNAHALAEPRERPQLRLLDELEERREESLHALTELVRLLGYPEGWAVELEEQAIARGVVWRKV